MISRQPATDDTPLLEHLTTAVIHLDAECRVLSLNAAAEQLFGTGESRALGHALHRLASLPDTLLLGLHDAIRSEQPYTERALSVRPHGGDPILIDCVVSLLREPDEQIGLILEITVIDRAVRIARDEALYAQQEHARSLLRGLAHEIKNPLGGLRGAAQLLAQELPDNELSDYTSIIIREADRLQNLIDRMLGPVGRPTRDLLNLHEVIEHVRAIARAGASPGITLRYDYDPSIPECHCDRDRLVQVLLNIAGNALTAMGDNGTLTFRTRVHSNFTVGGKRHRLVAALEIHDDGPGVPPDIADQIFYPMVTGTEHGTGLGLSIAQSTMHQLGGLIEFTSDPGQTVFTVLVPLETE